MTHYILPVYNRPQVVFEYGEGAWIFDTEGRRYLDFSSGVAVTLLGHAHPHLVQVLTSQANKLWHISNLFRIQAQERLAQRLVENTFGDRVFFTNSGVEAWECGVKVIRKYQRENGVPRRNRLITVEGCFHGRTLTAVSASRQEKMVRGFDPLVDGFDQVPFNDLESLRKAISPETAGICVEPIQGEGGIRVCSEGYLRGVREIADEFGLLVLLDEIQCGMGRTGRLFMYEWEGMEPDVMCIAKGLGGGFPLGACIVKESAGRGMTLGTHGSTFGGNPLATAVGNGVLDIVLQTDFLSGVEKISGILKESLSRIVFDYPRVFKELRGRGLLLGLQCHPPIDEVIQRLLSYRVLTVPAAQNVIRLLPPLIIGTTEVEEFCTILKRVAKDYEEGVF